ncbi:mandelate racemase/muconate lactonizing enzyme family protein [Botryobacter ruber]|uniref:mandelate racemase/muconate lactonizing enzyme family protein n=1 Tax=Botryobacter ruber TaxID=2171629 RepID=UPI000E0BB147|nr:dipeptide epimerase [Botryobacter ruber]
MNPMKITQIEVYKSPIKLKAPFVTALGPHTCAGNVVVVIRTNEGITGFGECSPFMAINGESMDTCFVVAKYLANVLKDKNPLDMEACSRAMDAVIYGNASIKSAFDMALYDIAAQQANLPLFAFLGGSNNKKITTDYTVSIGDPQKMAADALAIKNRGFRLIKVKLGEAAKDVERIRLIREAVGETIPIRIDANQGWSKAEAIETLKALAPYQIQYCEEPIPRWNFMALPEVRQQSPIPIMADESCCDHHDAKRLTDLAACDYINIKLGKSSGIFKALKIIEVAEQAGLQLQVGGFLESRLGFTASAHLALASDNIVYFDFDTPLMFVEDPVAGGIRYDSTGGVTLPDQPGLGATVDAQYLQRLEKMIIS